MFSHAELALMCTLILADHWFTMVGIITASSALGYDLVKHALHAEDPRSQGHPIKEIGGTGLGNAFALKRPSQLGEDKSEIAGPVFQLFQATSHLSHRVYICEGLGGTKGEAPTDLWQQDCSKFFLLLLGRLKHTSSFPVASFPSLPRAERSAASIMLLLSSVPVV